jgi:tRNA (guanine37-N1)-methyltransferase
VQATLKTVVNKVGVIETEFRTFPMEVIAGEENFDVSVRECGAVYQFSFKDVYWNSRLATEHGRLIDLITEERSGKKGTPQTSVVIADMMAGVGPFAVPLGMKHRFQVYANGEIIAVTWLGMGQKL